ncbi:MAG: PQQ-binding-like beta-propeller repeat protein [Planctomycetes bacterium]|nr:PQQ-binding-like beta-propeller repeat protein [Planctomycetota bacterium]
MNARWLRYPEVSSARSLYTERCGMRVILLLFTLFALTAPSETRGPEPVLKQSIPLPKVSGRIDHLTYDPATKRLNIAALEYGSVEVIDSEKGERVGSVKGLKEPQGIVFVPATHQFVVVCGGDGTVRAFDASGLTETAKTVVGDDADNMRLDAEDLVIVVGHGNGAISLLEAATLKKTGEVKFEGHPESFQLEPHSDRVFINVPGGLVGGGGKLIVADRSTLKVTTTWELHDAGRNFPMALDAEHKRLYVGCRRPSKLLMIDVETGKTLASPECIGDADEVFVDGPTGQVLVVGGDGAVDVFRTEDQKALARTASAKTAPGARTGLLVAETHTLFIAVPKRSGKDAQIREYSLAD